MYSTQTQFGIIGLEEIWFKDIPHNYFNLSVCNFEFQNRINKKGGDVCLYIKDGIKYNVITDLQQTKSPENVESLFIKIGRPTSKNIVFGVMYRHPDQQFNK